MRGRSKVLFPYLQILPHKQANAIASPLPPALHDSEFPGVDLKQDLTDFEKGTSVYVRIIKHKQQDCRAVTAVSKAQSDCNIVHHTLVSIIVSKSMTWLGTSSSFKGSHGIKT